MQRRLTRDGLLFAGGLVGIVHETVLRDVDRPVLLALFGAMVGLPAFFRADEKRKDAEEVRYDVRHAHEEARYDKRAEGERDRAE